MLITLTLCCNFLKSSADWFYLPNVQLFLDIQFNFHVIKPILISVVIPPISFFLFFLLEIYLTYNSVYV